MRLVFVSHSFPPVGREQENVGGMQRVAMELLAELQSTADPRLESLSTILLRSPWEGIMRRAVPFLGTLAPRLVHHVRKHRADTVLFSSITTALPLLACAPVLKRMGVRVASIAHGLDVTEPALPYQLGVKGVLRRLDAVFPVSSATGEQCALRGARHVQVVPNGVDLSRFGERRVEGGNLPVDEVTDDVVLLTSVGRQVKRKGFEFFVDQVMPKLPNHVWYWLAGDGPERANIEAAVVRNRLEDRVRCLGLIGDPELQQLMDRADLFVMPNIVVPGDMEGFGIVMLEAAASGVPVIAASLEGIRDVVREGVSGFLVPTEDADAFAERIRPMERAALATLGASARSDVQSRFSWPAVTGQYLEALVAMHPLNS